MLVMKTEDCNESALLIAMLKSVTDTENFLSDSIVDISDGLEGASEFFRASRILRKALQNKIQAFTNRTFSVDDAHAVKWLELFNENEELRARIAELEKAKD